VGDPRNECSESKSCNDTSANMSNIPISLCPCNGDNDPRRGITCEVTRSEKAEVYNLETCRSTKICIDNNMPIGCTPLCAVDSNQIVELESCFCNQESQPINCRCPVDSSQLIGIPTNRCQCIEEQDPRGQCYTCSSTFHPDSCICPSEPANLEGISSIQCRCLQSDDQRKECQPPEIGEDPSIDFGEIKPAEQKEIKNIEESRNDENSIENIISETIKGENSIGVKLPQNEVYEEENTIEVRQNQKLVLEAKIESEDQQIPVIRPSEQFKEDSNPLISVSNNGDMEIRSFIIEHFTQETQSPLLKTENDGVLRL
ncbi:MAG: hypothetical protein EZS28_050338, partial [Streblomastix strix]